MPIRADLKHIYNSPEWKEVIRPRILERAKNRCEFCGKPNRTDIYQIVDRAKRRMYWIEPIILDSGTHTHLIDHTGRLLATDADALPLAPGYVVRVVLTIAHLNHTPDDMRDENLAALCQWCHLNHDFGHHQLTRTARKDAGRPILTELGDNADVQHTAKTE